VIEYLNGLAFIAGPSKSYFTIYLYINESVRETARALTCNGYLGKGSNEL